MSEILALPDRLSRDSFCDAVCGSAVGKYSLSDIGGEVCTCAGGVGTLGLHTKLDVCPTLAPLSMLRLVVFLGA